MKDLVKKAQSFITFDAPLEIGHIQTSFATTHHQQQSMVPFWGVASTRQKLIAKYWLTDVTGHFFLLLAIPVLHFLLFSGDIGHGHLVVLLATGVLTFGVLLFFQYWPVFARDFLPRLEAVANAYRSEQQRQIIARLQERMRLQQEQFQQQMANATMLEEQHQEETTKCRQAQFSNLAVTLIYYVLAKASGMPDLQCNDQTANLLMQLYGKAPGSIRANLELITGSGGRRKKLSKRGRTEIINRFGEAYRFFEEQKFTTGIQLLKKLEIQVTSP